MAGKFKLWSHFSRWPYLYLRRRPNNHPVRLRKCVPSNRNRFFQADRRPACENGVFSQAIAYRRTSLRRSFSSACKNIFSSSVAYHLDSSKVQYLGNSHPRCYFRGTYEGFPYTPCRIGVLNGESTGQSSS